MIMPYRNKEKQAEYLRKWRQKRQQERVKQSRYIVRLLLSTYVSNNPRRYREKVRRLLPLVFGRVLTPDEEAVLLNHFDFSSRKFLEALIVCWREGYRRDIDPLEFLQGILFSPVWEICPECGRPYPR
ncbi:hypothetical protein SAMN02745218_02876 [Desulfofundulus australicus DSM 11792]|uniref:Uncharacterized protein n=2 Tax=Desulfofundulus australicus TaxID=1566 RepID=A0A1M5DNS2_9FIRM|nr:hypothetical protein SAMN02745218_02876 [Desulfofundulus australicus DSM 11792]